MAIAAPPGPAGSIVGPQMTCGAFDDGKSRDEAVRAANGYQN